MNMAVMTEARLVPLRKAGELQRFGGKASELSRCLSAGLPVPDGAALSHDDACLLEQGRARLSGFEALPVGATSFAVRSSGVGEDSTDASFAGQHLTKLGVNRDGVADAAVEVVRSGSAAGAHAYREQMKLAEGETTPMAVVVQQMVPAQVSGVLFTRHPLDKSDVRFVEASWGLGEVVVSGLVTPDQYQFSRGASSIEETIGDKDVAHFLTGDGTVVEERVGRERATLPCLSPDQLRQLDELASRVETLMKRPADIEWALSQGVLYLLQMRPITA